MRVALDSDVMIDALRTRAVRHKRAADFLRKIPNLGHVGILSPIVTHELYTGAYASPTVETAIRGLEAVFAKYRLEAPPYTLSMSKLAGEKAANYLARTKSAQLLERKRMDIMIGSHAMLAADCLITWNRDDYRKVGYGDLLILTPDEFISMYPLNKGKNESDR
ncbi:MAG: type II toxin-antitoxin system VapC family toxin [Candidatus Bathyarchaeia archaeon]